MNDCCDRLEVCYNTNIESFPLLKSRSELIALNVNHHDSFYRCTKCEQLWEEHFYYTSRIEEYFLIKAFLDESGNPRPFYVDYNSDEINFLDTQEVMKIKRVQPPSGCLLSWI